MQFPYRNDWTTKTGSFHPIKFNQYRLNFQDYLQHFTTSYTKIIISVWTRHSCVLNHSFFRNWTFKVKPKFSKQTTQLFNRVYLCVFICIYFIYIVQQAVFVPFRSCFKMLCSCTPFLGFNSKVQHLTTFFRMILKLNRFSA